MVPAALASAVMSPIHCLFGLHIVRRGVIFIDLAVAQFAALGAAFAVMQHHESGDPQVYWYSLAFALAGALLISLCRFKLNKVPHEAMIGIFFVVASAMGALLLESSPHGTEELRDSLTGSILVVLPEQVNKIAIAYGIILVVLIAMWRPVTKVSLREPDAPRGAWAVVLDFLFYGLLAFVVASSVQVAGILLVFTWLVMPAAAVFFWVNRMSVAVAVALPLSILASTFGLWLSFTKNYQTGPAMVVVMGAMVAGSYFLRLLVPGGSSDSRDPEPLVHS